MGRRLFVGNLSFSTNQDALRAALAEDDLALADVRIVNDRETGRSRGFAFVELAREEDLARALEAWNGRMLDGRPLRVSEAEARGAPRAGGPRPGGPRPGGPQYAGGPRPAAGGPRAESSAWSPGGPRPERGEGDGRRPAAERDGKRGRREAWEKRRDERKRGGGGGRQREWDRGDEAGWEE
jgi:RNA recognition motif-containing protein